MLQRYHEGTIVLCRAELSKCASCGNEAVWLALLFFLESSVLSYISDHRLPTEGDDQSNT